MNVSRIVNRPTSGASSATQACAACKYQRRKCTSDCLLAPYFPHDRARQFLNAHKLFGVSNIIKVIKPLGPFERDEAMKTIIFESDARAADPVGGCYRIVLDLQRQIEHCKLELDVIYHQLAVCRSQAAGANQNMEMPVEAPSSVMPDHLMMPYDYDTGAHGVCREDQNPLEWPATAAGDNCRLSPSKNECKQTANAGEGNDPCMNQEISPAYLDDNDIKFEFDELVERRYGPSTELVMS